MELRAPGWSRKSKVPFPTIFAGAHVQRGITSSTPITHYNVLRTLEDMYGLTPLAEAANASAITDVWDDVIFAAIFE